MYNLPQTAHILCWVLLHISIYCHFSLHRTEGTFTSRYFLMLDFYHIRTSFNAHQLFKSSYFFVLGINEWIRRRVILAVIQNRLLDFSSRLLHQTIWSRIRCPLYTKRSSFYYVYCCNTLSAILILYHILRRRWKLRSSSIMIRLFNQWATDR